MNKNNESLFYLPWRRRITLFIVVMWLPIMLTFSEFASFLAGMMLINITVPIIGMWHVFVVIVNADGIVLNKVNKLVWADIVSARKVQVLGLSHIRIKRKKGRPWLVPLFFIGKESIETVLRNNVPVNNPLYKVVSE